MGDRVCVCGDEEELHYENTEQCVVIGCGCKEFEEAPDEESIED